MKALDVFSISIIFMKTKCLEEVTKGFLVCGKVDDRDFDFVLTVPTIWGDAGKLFMREAALQVRF